MKALIEKYTKYVFKVKEIPQTEVTVVKILGIPVWYRQFLRRSLKRAEETPNLAYQEEKEPSRL